MTAAAFDENKVGVAEKAKGAKPISEDEAALYDRQIRLWGLEAQARLRNADVLLVGLSALGAEVAKNIVLAGLHSLTLIDHLNVTENDLPSFFLKPNSIGSNRASASVERCQALNPNVQVQAKETECSNLQQDDLSKFSLVCAVGQSHEDNNRLDKLCRAQSIAFCCGTVFGWLGYSFNDFGANFQFAEERKVDKEQTKSDDVQVVDELNQSDDQPSVKKVKLQTDDDMKMHKAASSFATYERSFVDSWPVKGIDRTKHRNVPEGFYMICAALAVQSDTASDCLSAHHLHVLHEQWTNTLAKYRVDNNKLNTQQQHLAMLAHQYHRLCGREQSSVAAIVGGVLAQEIIKAISERERPLVNVFVYSAVEGTGTVLHSPPTALL